MKFKNISEKTKHIMVDEEWLVVKPGDEFEIAKPGSLHLDPELGLVKEIVKKAKPSPKSSVEDNATLDEATGQGGVKEPDDGDGKKKDELDLNNDGVVDEKDSSIAGKVLANSRKKKSRSKK